MLRGGCRAPRSAVMRAGPLRVPTARPCTSPRLVFEQRRSYAKGGGSKGGGAPSADTKAIKDRAAAETRELDALESQLRGMSEKPMEITFTDREKRLASKERDWVELRPHLTQKTRDLMYSLHVSNPEKWNDEALAKRFGLLAARVRAILHLKKLEAEARERGHWVSPDDAIDEAYEELFGKAEMGFEEDADRDFKYEEPTPRLPRDMYIDPELDPIAMRARMKVLEPFEDLVSETPPADFPEEPSVLIHPSSHKPRKYKSKVLFMDSSKHVHDSERLLIISDTDGTLRTATWQERAAVLNVGVVTRNTSGRRNIWIPFGGAEKLQKYSKSREKLLDEMEITYEHRKTREFKHMRSMMHQASTAVRVAMGGKYAKELLEFADIEPPTFLPPVKAELGPNMLPELDERPNNTSSESSSTSSSSSSSPQAAKIRDKF